MKVERKPTTFEMKVYNAVEKIPRGTVVTYRELAIYIGVASAQAVGQALKRNPFVPSVPCHRVVSSNEKVGGFFGSSFGPQWDKKRAILENEGIEFSNGRIDLKKFTHRF